MATPGSAATTRQRQALGKLLATLGIDEPSLSADALLDEFGSLAGVLAGEPDRLTALTRDDRVGEGLPVVREAMLQSLTDQICERPVIASSDALVSYVRAQIAAAPAELVHVLFLDAQLGLIRDELMFRGTISEAPIYPREIIRRALELKAANLVVVHNHPSGDPSPSTADLERTLQLREAAHLFDLALVDHVIVTEFGFHSMRNAGAL